MKYLEDIHQFALDAANVGVFTLLVLLILEAGIPGSVVRFFNLLWLVVWVVLASVLAFVTHQERDRKPSSPVGLGLLGLAAAAYAWVALAPYASSFGRAVAAVMTLAISWLLIALL